MKISRRFVTSLDILVAKETNVIAYVTVSLAISSPEKVLFFYTNLIIYKLFQSMSREMLFKHFLCLFVGRKKLLKKELTIT